MCSNFGYRAMTVCADRHPVLVVPLAGALMRLRSLASLVLLLGLGLGLSGLAQAQVAASPLPSGLSAGSGPGIHSPNSPFAPLPDRTDVLPWSVLSNVKIKVVNKRVLPIFTPSILALNNKSQRVQGFMMPLEPGQRQTHFLLTSVPLTCAFCTPGGPESMIEIKTQTPVNYVMEALVVEGTLSVLPDDTYGLFYRISDAKLVK